MNINILTIFPEIFEILKFGVVSRSISNKTLLINLFDIRANSVNRHKHIDAKPYGGGEGMVMICLLYTSPSPRDLSTSRMPSSA